MKWQHRIAHVIFSPGLSGRKTALKVVAEWSGYERRNGLGRMVVLEETHTYRSPLSGRILWAIYPGLKPWAICVAISWQGSVPAGTSY